MSCDHRFIDKIKSWQYQINGILMKLGCTQIQSETNAVSLHSSERLIMTSDVYMQQPYETKYLSKIGPTLVLMQPLPVCPNDANVGLSTRRKCVGAQQVIHLEVSCLLNKSQRFFFLFNSNCEEFEAFNVNMSS